jgi:hypothetical protein
MNLARSIAMGRAALCFSVHPAVASESETVGGTGLLSLRRHRLAGGGGSA